MDCMQGCGYNSRIFKLDFTITRHNVLELFYVVIYHNCYVHVFHQECIYHTCIYRSIITGQRINNVKLIIVMSNKDRHRKIIMYNIYVQWKQDE